MNPLYKVVGTKTLQDSEGNEVSCEVRDYGLTKDEIDDENFNEDIKYK